MTVRSGRDHGPYHTGEEKRESSIFDSSYRPLALFEDAEKDHISHSSTVDTLYSALLCVPTLPPTPTHSLMSIRSSI
jgi:hypothetical protein